ncbi:MAG: CPBP family intramembrane metalloprotease [Planctomycetaceae bacterium]|nr:CPBP family intramembrane metalloprotease [Planctomycetaceae bacterium]
MTDSSILTSPLAPSASDFIRGGLYALYFATLLVVVPFQGLWGNTTLLWSVSGVALILVLLTCIVQQTRELTAVLLVLLVWQSVTAINQKYLPATVQGLTPQNVSDFSSSSRLVILLVAILFLPLVTTLLVCLFPTETRTRFCAFLRVGSWSNGIRWPLPWWGVAPMPLWVFVVIALPFAFGSFLPMIDWQKTAMRWQEASWAVVLMIPLLALINAIVEELIFRVGLISLFSKRLSPEAATIPAAVTFGFVHYDGGFPSGLTGALLLSVGGFYLGYFLLIQKGLSAVILWHFLMDLVVFSSVFK